MTKTQQARLARLESVAAANQATSQAMAEEALLELYRLATVPELIRLREICRAAQSGPLDPAKETEWKAILSSLRARQMAQEKS